MFRELITGIIFTEFDDNLGPNPYICLPDLPIDTKMLISIKALTLLTGEEAFLPESITFIPFPSIGKKGIVKYIEWEQKERRGGIALSCITILINEADDLVFYKDINELQKILDKVAVEIKRIKLSKDDDSKIVGYIEKCREEVIVLLDNLYKQETMSSEAFPEANNKKDAEFVFKIIVCGDPQVGKTSTILRFTDKAFKRKYLPTVGVNITEKDLKIDNNHVFFVIWDIAGQAKFDIMRKHFYQGAEGLFFLFDLTRSETFENISNWYKDITDSLGENQNIPGFLLGNKKDLTKQRKIDKDTAKSLAVNLNLDYFETSALTGENVDNSFKTLAKKLLENKKK